MKSFSGPKTAVNGESMRDKLRAMVGPLVDRAAYPDKETMRVIRRSLGLQVERPIALRPSSVLFALGAHRRRPNARQRATAARRADAKASAADGDGPSAPPSSHLLGGAS